MPQGRIGVANDFGIGQVADFFGGQVNNRPSALVRATIQSRPDKRPVLLYLRPNRAAALSFDKNVHWTSLSLNNEPRVRIPRCF